MGIMPQAFCPAVTLAFITAEKANDDSMNIAWACRTLGVSASGYDDWLRAQVEPCQRRRQDNLLRDTVVRAPRLCRSGGLMAMSTRDRPSFPWSCRIAGRAGRR
jgi:hypothetical protein